MTKEVLDAVQVLDTVRDKAREGEVGATTPVMQPSDRDDESGDQRDHHLMDRTILSAIRLEMLKKELARPIRVSAGGEPGRQARANASVTGRIAETPPGVEDIPERQLND